MDAILTGKAEQLAREIASQATTLAELNGLLKLMMGSALEQHARYRNGRSPRPQTVAWGR